jgi:2-polyprenyl-6-methoxyphenol hydroxylase-like FAD-dependent oxidoreductase
LRVDWNTELVSYTQDESNVTAIIRDVNTKEETIVKSVYIVGADGTHSKVRKGNSDWTYEGVAINTKFALADLTLKGKDAEILKEKANVFTSGAAGKDLFSFTLLMMKKKNINI